MKPKKSDQQQLWVEAQRRCRLSAEAVRMARELGIGPRSLIGNIPSPKQRWKAPVEDWVRDLYAKRRGSPPQPEDEPSGLAGRGEGGGALVIPPEPF